MDFRVLIYDLNGALAVNDCIPDIEKLNPTVVFRHIVSMVDLAVVGDGLDPVHTEYGLKLGKNVKEFFKHKIMQDQYGPYIWHAGTYRINRYSILGEECGDRNAILIYIKSDDVIAEHNQTVYNDGGFTMYPGLEMFNRSREMGKRARQIINGIYGAPAKVDKVIFNNPATIVFWSDGTKTVVKCKDDEEYDPEKGLAMAISKKMLGNKYHYYDVFAKWLKKYKKSHVAIPCDTCTSNKNIFELARCLTCNDNFSNFRKLGQNVSSMNCEKDGKLL